MKIGATRADGRTLNGRLRYLAHEHSFDFVPEPGQSPSHGAGVLLIGTLQIAVDVATGRAVFVDGLRPRGNWVASELEVPVQRDGAVLFELEDGESFIRGVGFEIPGADRWGTFFDAASGWVCVGDKHAVDGVRIATNTVLCIREGELVAVWLRPDFEG